MINKDSKKEIREKKHYRMRKNLVGTTECPRMSVFRSDKHMYVQIIDDSCGKTLVSASTLQKEVGLQKTNDVEAAKTLGEFVGKKALDAGIKNVVFDRGGFLYHGKIKAVADGARSAGLEF